MNKDYWNLTFEYGDGATATIRTETSVNEKTARFLARKHAEEGEKFVKVRGKMLDGPGAFNTFWQPDYRFIFMGGEPPAQRDGVLSPEGLVVDDKLVVEPWYTNREHDHVAPILEFLQAPEDLLDDIPAPVPCSYHDICMLARQVWSPL